MRQTQFKPAVLVLVIVVFACRQAVAEEAKLPRVVVYHLAGSTPNLDILLPRLTAELSEAGMEIELDGMELAEFPKTDEAWLQAVRNRTADARTVAALSYECADVCTARLIQLRSRAVVSISYKRFDDLEKRTKSTAATLREILLGPLVGELRRLASEARRPSAPGNSAAVLLQSPFESDRRKNTAEVPPKLWLEGAYQGDYPHPSGRPLNGVCLGVEFDPAAMLGLSLHLGWLGSGRTEVDGASIGLQRMTGDLTVRLVFGLGPARIGIGAIGRLDLVFSNVDNPADFADVSDRYLEVHVGGITTWHLPLPGGVNLIIGAGLAASVLSREVTYTGVSGNPSTGLPASTLRMIWTVGAAFSPLRSNKLK